MGPLTTARASEAPSAAASPSCTTLSSRADVTSIAAPQDAVQIPGVPAVSDSLTSMLHPSNRLGSTAPSASANADRTPSLATTP